MPSRRIRSSASATFRSASSSGKSLRACPRTGELKSGIPTVSGIRQFYPMDDAFALQNFFGFAEVIAHIGLGLDPIDVALDALSELDLRFVANRTELGRVTGQMAHFAGAKFAARNWLDVDLERGGNRFGDFADGRAAATPDVHGLAVELVGLRGKQVSPRDVLHE